MLEFNAKNTQKKQNQTKKVKKINRDSSNDTDGQKSLSEGPDTDLEDSDLKTQQNSSNGGKSTQSLSK